ncbi:MAG: efflux RND transporter periplasmic adaptor subunit [Rhodothalassiaceae bacterium]
MRLVMCLATLAVAACGDQGQGGQQQRPTPQVTVAQPLSREVVEYDEFTGQFDAVERVEVRARVSGYLEEVAFEDGELVASGDRLFVIDQRPFQIALQAAQADLERAQAQVDLAERELSRAQDLRSRGNISQAEVDRRLEELRVARGQLRAAQANVDEAELNLEFTTVTAPIAGRVGRRRLTPGNLVDGSNTGATVLTTLVSQNPIYFYFDVSESDFLKYTRIINAGERPSAREQRVPVSVKLLDEEEFVHEGYIDFVDNTLDQASGTLEVRAVIDNDEGYLLPGQFGRLRFPVLGPEPREALLVPDASLLADQARRYVLTVDGEGKVARRFVQPGPIVDGLRLIRDGLSGDDRIIIAGQQQARPGAQVKVRQGRIEAEGSPGQ